MIDLPFSDPEGRALPLLRSTAIPSAFRHGFATRAGGVSAPPFDTFNLGGKWGDVPASVAENRRRLARAAGAPLFIATQVHGVAIARVRAGDTPADVARVQADGLCTDRADVALAVFVADCIPALVADARTGAIAAVHAGWRGTLAGVLAAAVRALGATCRRARRRPARRASVPRSGRAASRWAPRSSRRSRRACPARAPRASSSPPDGGRRATHGPVDANRRQALSLGAPAAMIDVARQCTSCDPARFFSYRRDRGRTGQMAAFIARAPAGGVVAP